MSRWKASGLHFGISVAIAVALLSLMLALWYPPPYFTLMGGAMLVFLIAGCDVVLGPLITLIIFRSGKKGLALDLALIGFVQATALAYGLYVMFESRPAFTVFAIDRFEVVAANDIDPEELAKATRPDFRSLSWTGPRLVGAKLSENPEERMRMTADALEGGRDIKDYPRLYTDYVSVALDAARRARPLSALLHKSGPDRAREIDKALAGFLGRQEDFGYLPVVGRFHAMSAIVDKHSGRMQAIVDVAPW